MPYSLRSVINQRLDGKTGKKVFFAAGKLAGTEFCENLPDVTL